MSAQKFLCSMSPSVDHDKLFKILDFIKAKPPNAELTLTGFPFFQLSLSTFFTSIVVWLILKWDTVSFNKDSIKYVVAHGELPIFFTIFFNHVKIIFNNAALGPPSQPLTGTRGEARRGLVGVRA